MSRARLRLIESPQPRLLLSESDGHRGLAVFRFSLAVKLAQLECQGGVQHVGGEPLHQGVGPSARRRALRIAGAGLPDHGLRQIQRLEDVLRG
jgi:hypothetical protein